MNANDIVEGFRKVVQDLLVPELKVVQAELKHLNEKIDLNQKENNRRFEQADKRMDVFQQEMKEMRIEIINISIIQQKILDKIDVDKRVIRLETLVEQLIRKAA